MDYGETILKLPERDYSISIERKFFRVLKCRDVNIKDERKKKIKIGMEKICSVQRMVKINLQDVAKDSNYSYLFSLLFPVNFINLFVFPNVMSQSTSNFLHIKMSH